LHGAAFYLASETPRKSRIVPLSGDPQETFDAAEIIDAVRSVAAPATIVQTRLVADYETYYVDRAKRLPLPVLYVELSDALQSGYYIDARTGRVVQSYGCRFPLGSLALSRAAGLPRSS
jgi:hypothetical protein